VTEIRPRGPFSNKFFLENLRKEIRPWQNMTKPTKAGYLEVSWKSGFKLPLAG
jgi:hypothetical protein